MADVYFLYVTAALLLKVCGPAAGVTEESSGPVFVSPQAANAVLLRQRRYNSGHLEELQKDNLERECKEEVCTMEEAREVFEDDEQTMEFWANYIDGDQCQPPPCQNDGVCADGVGSYICWCKPNFGGKNCEIEVTKQCSVDNGGCSHFCVMQAERSVCQCAVGYKLGPDKRKCEPTGPFSCGNLLSKSTSTSSSSSSRTILTPRTSSNSNLSDALSNDYYDDNITQLFDYYDHPVKDSDPSDIPSASQIVKRSLESDSKSSSSLDNVSVNSSDHSNFTDFPYWAFFPTLPSVTAEKNTDQRIVGGDEANPGEVPWQVTLMTRTVGLDRAQPFCGGSLLSELWVITAAHCLVQNDIPKRGFFVRVGEHDVGKDEGSERDHLVAEQHIHHSYDSNRSLYNHDIALLKLTSPVELSHHRQPICLGPKDFTENLLRESSSSLVSGWGRQSFLGREATRLQKVAVPYVDRTRCKQSSRYHVTRFMFCAGFEHEKKDACQGDSGGPHATNFKGTWFLTGIVSWGEECAKDGKYGIYTRVSRYYPWISQRTGLRINHG